MWLLDEHTSLTRLWLRGVGETWEEMNSDEMKVTPAAAIECMQRRPISGNGQVQVPYHRGSPDDATMTLKVWRGAAAEMWSGAGLGLKFACESCGKSRLFASFWLNEFCAAATGRALQL